MSVEIFTQLMDPLLKSTGLTCNIEENDKGLQKNAVGYKTIEVIDTEIMYVC